jgi:hypothetical protein
MLEAHEKETTILTETNREIISCQKRPIIMSKETN